MCVAFSLNGMADTKVRNFRGSTEVLCDGLPTEKQGRYPIEMPDYAGIDQILVLDSHWVIAIVSYAREVTDEINALSGGELYRMYDLWMESKAAGRPNWTAYKAPAELTAEHMADARKATGEESLYESETYTISSESDRHFRKGRHPRRVTQFPRPLGGKTFKYGPNIHWANYCFLELPKPMRNGSDYTITLADGKKATFTYDELRTVSRAIKVNQIGYLASAEKKYAYMGAYLYEHGPLDLSEARTFKVINAATGEIALEGGVELVAKNPRFAPRPYKGDDPEKRRYMYGEDVYRLDLGPLQARGEFFVTAPGVGRSWTFHHGEDTYGPAFYTAARGLFHQRCGVALKEPFTAWTRGASELHSTVYEADYLAFPPGSSPPKDYQIFDAVGGTRDLSRKTEGVVGGWHDAADWDRSNKHYACVFDLLNAYEMKPDRFSDGQLNLPESGNGVPDILDEAEFGIRVWAKSMNKEGGVSGYVETHTHPSMDDPECPYAFSRRTRWDSLIFAAAAAQYATLVKPFDPGASETYADLGKRAFAFGSDTAKAMGKRTLHAKRRRGIGEAYTFEWEEKEEYTAPFLIHAKLQLFKLTGSKAYLRGVPDLFETAKKPWEWPFTMADFSNWLYFDIARAAKNDLPAELVEAARNLYIGKAESLLNDRKGIPYGYTLPDYKDYWLAWGASSVTNHNRVLYCAYVLTGDRRYSDAAIQNSDFMLGANPLGMSWTTGMGYVYPVDIQHALSEWDGLMDPVPGLTLYGTTGAPVFHRFREGFWQAKTAEGQTASFIREENKRPPFWRSFTQHPRMNTGQCEFTVHETMAGNIFNAAMLMGEGWMPDSNTKTRGPRDPKVLFGYWMLP